MKFKKGLNCSADSFYSSQGRITSEFIDLNENLIHEIKNLYPEASSFEMETFHLYDMAENSSKKFYASGACIAMAGRLSNEFIDLDSKHKIEKKLGQAALDALIEFPLDESEVMNDKECVWHKEYVS